MLGSRQNVCIATKGGLNNNNSMNRSHTRTNKGKCSSKPTVGITHKEKQIRAQSDMMTNAYIRDE